MVDRFLLRASFGCQPPGAASQQTRAYQKAARKAQKKALKRAHEQGSWVSTAGQH